MMDLGIMAATFSVTYGIGKLFCGILADKAAVRSFMGVGLLLSGIINLFYGFLNTLWPLVIFWGINGFCQACRISACSKIACILVFATRKSKNLELVVIFPHDWHFCGGSPCCPTA